MSMPFRATRRGSPPQADAEADAQQAALRDCGGRSADDDARRIFGCGLSALA